MRSIALLFALLHLCSRLLCDDVCQYVNNLTFPEWDASDNCTSEMFSNINIPAPLRNFTTPTGEIKHDCGIVFILDLDRRFTTELNFYAVKLFMSSVINTCHSRGVGNFIIFNVLFAPDDTSPDECCDGVDCSNIIDSLAYEDYVGYYDSTDVVQNETAQYNFSYEFLKYAKQLSGSTAPCLYNTIIMLSNRVFNSNFMWDNNIVAVEGYSCETTTIIGVGNPDITDAMLEQYYTEITLNQYVAPSYNCLPYLATCIKPCGPDIARTCQDFQNAANCSDPTVPPPTTTASTPTTTTNDKVKIAVRFLARNNSDSDWLMDVDSIHDHLVSLKTEEILLNASPAIDIYDSDTLSLILRAMAITVSTPPGEKGEEPRLVLLTDFVSQTFIDTYNQNDTLIKKMEKFDFEIYCFDEEAAQIYINQTVIKAGHIHTDPDFSDDKSYLVPICSKNKKTSLPIIMLIIVGTCVGVMVILILVTILYRQKYMWSEKLNRFKTSQSGRAGGNEDDVIDYWELSWDKLIVKNERLGHGAYGQVFKGKLIGPSPGIEKFHRSEVGHYTDCDCAVKMLPRYASENARTEFMHEIQLMKTLGIHDNIVNMLGCITAGKSCLVLEYCSNRDLLRYLKQKRVELEISKSMDDQIELTKELMHLAWQIANGMRFLGDKDIIHRDLAARNILISGLEGLKNAKIGDFGLAMSASPGENALSASGRLPIKWLALESLQKEQFSFKSDVWSFGIVLFEMYSLGEIPFETVEPIELIPHLVQGNRPKPPLMAPEKIAEMMIQCWNKNPEERPTFQEMKDALMTLLEQATEGYGYLALLKTTENYRVISEISEEVANPIDDYYADSPCRIEGLSDDIISLSSDKLSAHSRIQLDISVSRRPSRKRAITLRSTSGSDEEEDKNENSEESPESWVTKVRRRRSQLAQLNPFRKIVNLTRSTSKKGRTGSV